MDRSRRMIRRSRASSHLVLAGTSDFAHHADLYGGLGEDHPCGYR